MAARDRIKVVCRIRPENKIEKDGNYKRVVKFDGPHIAVECAAETKDSDRHEFTFDAVFGPDS